MGKSFHREENCLHCEAVDIKELASTISTPFYLYSHGGIGDNLKEFQKSLQGYDSLVAYALKANSSKALVNLMAGKGAGADVVSIGELQRALEAGIPAKRIVFAGVGKKKNEIRFALKQNILGLNVESLSELKTINEIAGEFTGRAPVAIRVKPGSGSEAHPYLSTGDRSSKFGVSRDKAVKGFELIRRSENLEAAGIHAHIGSQIDSLSPYKEAASFLGELVDELSQKGVNVDYVDFGGGFGIGMGSGEVNPVPATKDFVSALLAGFGKRKGDYRLLIEPGRAIVGPAGALIGKVIRRKETSDRTFLITDVGMNDLIRPALYGSEHEIVPLMLKQGSREREKVDVVGPLCESGDFIARGKELPRMEAGDGFAVLGSGAYGASMASNYNSRLRGSEILVKGSSYEVVRKRETVEDLVARERRPSFP